MKRGPPGRARHYSDGREAVQRGLSGGAERLAEDAGDPLRSLQMRVVAEVVPARSAGPPGAGRGRPPAPPASRPGPPSPRRAQRRRASPAAPRASARPAACARPCSGSAGGRCAGPRRARISAHWSAASSSVSGCSGEKIEPNWLRKKRSLLSRETSGPSRPRRSRCPRVGLAASWTIEPFRSRTPASSKESDPSRSRAISSLATEVPMSWPTTKTGSPGRLAADRPPRQIRLPDQRVVVVPRLVREAVAEEVRREHRPIRRQLDQQAPVIRAGREAVQEQQDRPLALAREQVDAVAVEAGLGAAVAPGDDPGRSARRSCRGRGPRQRADQLAGGARARRFAAARRRARGGPPAAPGTRGRTCAGSGPPARGRGAPRRGPPPTAAPPRSGSARAARAALAGQLLEDPGVAERSAGDHHRVRPRLLVGAAGVLGGVEAAGDDHRRREPARELAGERVVGLALVTGGWRAAGGRRSPATPASSTSRRASS